MSFTNTVSSGKSNKLRKDQIRTLTLSSIGAALEFYDFMIFVFFAKVISVLFFPSSNYYLSELNSYATFIAAYFARPFGGIIMAYYGDKFGRKSVFVFSILLMAAATLGIGLLPTYSSIGVAAPILLVILRLIQGVSFGGELPGAWVFVGEHSSKKRFGLSLGILNASIVSGILLGSVVTFFLNAFLTQQDIENGWWRFPFILGAIFGFISMLLRRHLHETPVFKEIQAKTIGANHKPLTQVINKGKLGFVLTYLLIFILVTMVFNFTLFASNFLRSYEENKLLISISQIITILCVMVGSVFFGWLSDRTGKIGIPMILSSAIFIVCSYFFFSGISNKVPLIDLLPYSFIGGFSVGWVGILPNAALRAFKCGNRFSGVSASCNISYAISGSITTFLALKLLRMGGDNLALYISAVGVFAFILGLFYLFIEDKLAPYSVEKE